MQMCTAYFIGDKNFVKVEVYVEVIQMKIQSYPKAKEVRLIGIDQGECFITISDELEGRKSPYDYDWCDRELFMRCEEADDGLIHVVHLVTGTHDMFNENLFVERVKAHIICE